MKLYKSILAFVICCCPLINGCDDNLNIEPEQSLTPEAALGSSENIQNLLVGAYDLAGQNEIFSGDYNLASELLANNGEIAWRGTYLQPAEFNRKVMTTGNSFVTDNWVYSYGVTNQVNLVLENLDKIEDEQTAATVEGNAKFLRGLIYFDLLRFFALPYEPNGPNDQLGVPIVLNGVSDATQIEFPARNTVAEGYAQVIQDLTDAVKLLPHPTDADPYYANSIIAQALLARIYLQQGNFTAARDAADLVIADGSYALAATFSGAFNNEGNGSEDIFAWQITTQDGVNDMNTFWAIRLYGGRSLTGDVTVEDPYFTIFDDGNDDRKTFFYDGEGTLSTTKWQSQFANVPFIRLAEMYLIRAESNFRLGTAIGATPLDDINTLRARARALPAVNIDLESILTERKKELAFEGFALHDLKRLKQSVFVVENKVSVELPYDAGRLVMPIPQREIDANENLVQNPGYTN